MPNKLKSYIIKYSVHCKLENFFDKEMIVKNCLSEVQAKYKLGAYYEKKYGNEFEYIKFESITLYTENKNFDNIFSQDKDIFNYLKDITSGKK